MGLGGAGGAADAVPAGAAAQQDDHIAGGGFLAADMAGRRCTHDRADLHALGSVAGVIQFRDLAGGKADLVAVAGVTGSSGGDQLALGQLAGHRLGDRLQRVGCAGHAHGLVDVAAAGQGIADGTADAGGSTAERLDLGGVVVGLILKEEQPVLQLAVDIALDLDSAGVDLLALVQVLQDSALLQGLGGDGGAVHQGAVLLVAASLLAQGHVAVKGSLHQLVIDLHIVQNGTEGSVAAVVGPVGVDQADLGDGGVAVLGLEVVLAELDVGVVHGQALLVAEGFQGIVVQGGKAGQGLHLGGDGKLHLEGAALLKAGFTCLDGVDDVLFNGGDVVLSQIALQQVDAGAAHGGALALAEQLDALTGRVSTLVKLAGQVLNSKNVLGLGQGGVGGVYRRLAEDSRDGLLEQDVVDTLDIITVDEPQTFQGLNAQQVDQLVAKALSLAVKTGLFLNINAIYHCIFLRYCIAASALAPMSLRLCSLSKWMLSLAA